MFRIISNRRLEEIKQEERRAGISLGYDLGWKMRELEVSNLGFITGSKLDRELDEILRRKGM